MTVRKANQELLARLAHIIDHGSPDLKAAAEARVDLLFAAYTADRDKPSSMPILSQVEAMIWDWWHDIDRRAEKNRTQQQGAHSELRAAVGFQPV
jgi:hypothetical protein